MNTTDSDTLSLELSEQEWQEILEGWHTSARRRKHVRRWSVPEDEGAPREDTPDAFFAYGIFRSEGTTHGVIGREIDGNWARLDDYKRVRFGCAYVVPAEGYHVIGRLYEGIRPHEWSSLDGVEGVYRRHYDRIKVKVTRLHDGVEMEAQVYQAGPDTLGRAVHAREEQEVVQTGPAEYVEDWGWSWGDDEPGADIFGFSD